MVNEKSVENGKCAEYLKIFAAATDENGQAAIGNFNSPFTI